MDFKVTLVVIAALFGLSACYPTLQTERPKVELLISDGNGRPIEGATFALAIYNNPFAMLGDRRISTRQTDANGLVSLNRKHKFRLQVLMPDAVGWYSWGYCVEKPGYQAVVVAESRSQVTGKMVLKASEASSVCKFPSAEDAYFSGPVPSDPLRAQPAVPADRGERRRSR